MEVTRKQLIRDGSGDFGCPNCWPEARVTPKNTECPNCQMSLEWPYDAKEAHYYWLGRKFWSLIREAKKELRDKLRYGPVESVETSEDAE